MSRKVAQLSNRRALAVGAEDSLPTEFLIFSPGDNLSTKGSTLFDDTAAKAVMSVYTTCGVDLPIDLEHDSTYEERRAQRSDAADARGWFQLEVRDGALWAVNVTWTPDGAERLRSKKQRYISPYFAYDDDGRVVELINVALCAQPATLHARPLVAASRLSAPGAAKQRRNKMDPETIRAAITALKEGNADAALKVLEDILAAAAGAGPAPSAPEGGEALAETPDATALTALAKEVRALQSRDKTREAALSALAAEAQALRAEREKREKGERLQLVGELVSLGAETPATAWSDPGGDPKDRKPVKRLLDEPIDDLRTRVRALSAAAPQQPVRPPAGGGAGTKALSSRQAEIAARFGLDDAAKARFARLAVGGANG